MEKAAKKGMDAMSIPCWVQISVESALLRHCDLQRNDDLAVNDLQVVGNTNTGNLLLVIAYRKMKRLATDVFTLCK